MSDVGAFRVLFGDNVLSRNNLLPWWEKFQNYFVTLYVIFIILFGVTNASTLPYCLPDDGDFAKEMSDAETEFFASYCHYQKDNLFDPITLRFQIICVVFFSVIVCNTLLEGKEISSSVNVYSKAEKKITKLHLPLQDLKYKAVTPILNQSNHNTTEMKIREIITTLIHYKSGDPRRVLVGRGIFTTILLSFTFGAVFWLTVGIISGCNGPHTYNCVIKSDLNTTRNFTKFVCSELWSHSDWTIVFFYQGAIAGHLAVCVLGLRRIRKIRQRVTSRSCHGSREFLKARQCMLLLAELSKATRENETLFYEFINFLFDEETLNIMERSIRLACGLNLKEDQTDQDYLSMYTYVVDKKYLRKLQSQENTILQRLIEKRMWKPIVMILNTSPVPFPNMAAITRSVLIPDECGKNILYYALNRRPGFVKFKTHAATCILNLIDHVDRFVINENKQIKAADFIRFQYESDPTYPTAIKTKLLNLVGVSQQRDDYIEQIDSKFISSQKTETFRHGWVTTRGLKALQISRHPMEAQEYD